MADCDDATRSNSTHSDSRRRFLAVLAAAGAGGLAGCGSGGNGGDGADPTATETDAPGGGDANGCGEASDEPGSTETTTDGGGDGGTTDGSGGDDGDGDGDGGVGESAADPYGGPCPMPPFSYSEQTYEAPNTPVASFTMDTPEFANVTKAGGITFRFGNADSTTAVRASFRDVGDSVSDILDSYADEFEESTDQFDLTPPDARSFTQEPAGLWSTLVLYPVEEGIAVLSVGLQTDQEEFACSEAAEEIRVRAVESIGPV